MNSLEEVKNIPIAGRSGRQIGLRNVATVSDGTTLGEYDRYNMQRMLTLSANISGEDLGRAAGRVQQAIIDAGQRPDRVNVTVRGQIARPRRSTAPCSAHVRRSANAIPCATCLPRLPWSTAASNG
jgi:multidrug efflux pump subunit AcrB